MDCINVKACVFCIKIVCGVEHIHIQSDRSHRIYCIIIRTNYLKTSEDFSLLTSQY